jgi:hypothetical protein
MKISSPPTATPFKRDISWLSRKGSGQKSNPSEWQSATGRVSSDLIQQN